MILLAILGGGWKHSTRAAEAEKRDALTLRLDTIKGAIHAAAEIVIAEYSQNAMLQSASDVLDLVEQEIERLKFEIAGEAHG